MELCSRILGKQNISRNNCILNRIHNSVKSKLLSPCTRIHYTSCDKILILTMCKNRDSNLSCKPHCLSVYTCIHNRLSILAECHGSCFVKFLNVCKEFSFLSCRNCCDRKNINFCDILSLIYNILKCIYVVHCRSRIRHRTYRCESTLGCCHRTCSYSLLMFKSRLSEMCIKVNQSWHNHAS